MNEFDKRMFKDLARISSILNQQEQLKKTLAPFDDAAVRAMVEAESNIVKIPGLYTGVSDELTKNMMAPCEDPLVRAMADAKSNLGQLAGIKAEFDEQEHIRKLLGPLDNMFRAVEEPTAALAQLSGMKTIADAHEEFKKLIAPAQNSVAFQVADVTPGDCGILSHHLVQEFPDLHGTQAKIEAARQLTILEDYYRRPTWDTVLDHEAKRIVAENPLFTTACTVDWLDTMKQSLSLRRHPWLNESDPATSIRAVMDYHVLGSAINTFHPFSETVAEAARHVLGDWSNVAELPQEIFTDPDARRDFYIAHGYDSALSSLPGPARAESRYFSGITDIPPVSLRARGEDAPRDDSQEADGLTLASQAREMLAALERELRQFIDAKLTESCGSKWTTQRVPAGIVKNMRERRDYDKRFNDRQHPAVEYLDFTDYSEIIIRKDNWTEIFKGYFRREGFVKEAFLQLAPIRNAVMHSRPITQDDMEYLSLDVKRVREAMRRQPLVDGATAS